MEPGLLTGLSEPQFSNGIIPGFYHRLARCLNTMPRAAGRIIRAFGYSFQGFAPVTATGAFRQGLVVAPLLPLGQRLGDSGDRDPCWLAAGCW